MERELKYMILNANEVDAINFMDVMDQSTESLVRSKDGSKIYVKWERDDVPSSIAALTTKEGPFTHSEMKIILSRTEWKE